MRRSRTRHAEDPEDSKPVEATPAPAGDQQFFGDLGPEQPAGPPREQRKIASSSDDLSMGGDFDRIITSLFDEFPDAEVAYKELVAALTLGVPASIANYGIIVDALDKSEENARRCAALLANAKVSHADFEIDAGIISGGLRDRAVAVLEKQKAGGLRSKAPTLEDISSYMAVNFPDEHRNLERRRARAKRMVEYLENLTERWKERCKDLRAMCARVRET